MKVIPSNGVNLHVSDFGPRDGRVVMFANSLGTDLRVWEPLMPLMPEDLRIVRYDKRGHGLSDCPPGPYTLDELVADAACLADSLELNEITFVGLSIGGLIGQGLAVARPGLLKALVLMDTAAKIGNDRLWADRIALLDSIGLEGMADTVMGRWFSEGFRAERQNELAIWRNMLTRTPKAGYGGARAAIAGADFTSTTPGLDLPVMAMAGLEDGATPPDLVRATAELCGGVFHALPDAGHLPCVEQPEAVAALIGEFLKETA